MSEGQEDHITELLQTVLDEAARLIIANFPILKQICMDFVDVVFCPKIIAKQLVLAIALDTGMVTINQLGKIIQSILANFNSRKRLIRKLMEDQKNATTQDGWMELAEQIDNIQGNDIWRSDPNCPLYERDRISARIDEIVHLVRRRDLFELMFELRGGIGRNKFGLLHEGLFSKAMAGSKVLVETYHNVVCASLDFVCDSPTLQDEDPIPTDTRLAFFNEMRHSYGRTALLLSGGAALGFYHVGVCKTLILNNLMPRVIGGSSAGSILCSMLATRTDEEFLGDLCANQRGTTAPGHSGILKLNFFRPLVNYNEDYENDTDDNNKTALGKVYNNTAGAFHDAKRTWQVFVPIGLRTFTSTIYDIITFKRRPQDLLMNDTNHFRSCCKANIGNFTFQEAFDRTGRILNIVVTPQNSTDPPRLLNYLTAPHVLIWSAAVASSSLPGVFEANRLMLKDADGTERYECAAGQKFSDGSMEQDLPMQQLSEMFNVNHFIISQANPHAVMFASYNQNKSIWTNPVTGMIDAVLMFLKNQLRVWLQDVVEFIGSRSISPLFQTRRGLFGAQVITQEYEGRDCDISLVPWLGHRSVFNAFLHCIYNPNTEEFFQWIQAAERETWKSVPAIKSHIAEEITLDLCVQRLRKRLVSERAIRQKRQQQYAGQLNQHNSTSEMSEDNKKKSIMGERVPSFFTSPSLVNLSGLSVSDPTQIEDFTQSASAQENDFGNKVQPPPAAIASVGINSGWGGLGLRGNRSSASLSRTASHGSGLFIDDAEDNDRGLSSTTMPAGEHSTSTSMQPPGPSGSTMVHSSSGHLKNNRNNMESNNSHSDTDIMGGYVKTTNMASFYYRNTTMATNSYSFDDMNKIALDSNKNRLYGMNGDRMSHAGTTVTTEDDSTANTSENNSGRGAGPTTTRSRSQSDIQCNNDNQEQEKQFSSTANDKLFFASSGNV